MKHALLCLGLLMTASAVASSWVERPIGYTIGDVRFESKVVLALDEEDTTAAPRPGILLFPNWMGPSTEGTLAKARQAAGDDFIVMVVDMYGVDSRPGDARAAGELAGEVRGDRDAMRARANAALEAFRALEGDLPLRSDAIAAIGFCFGGGVALELGRAGADLDAIVSFHGDVLSPTLAEDAEKTTAKILLLHGADDPYVPQEHIEEWIGTMRQTDVDWQLVQFSGAVHSFTDPSANSPGQAHYHPVVAKRAFEMMNDLLEEIWEE